MEGAFEKPQCFGVAWSRTWRQPSPTHFCHTPRPTRQTPLLSTHLSPFRHTHIYSSTNSRVDVPLPPRRALPLHNLHLQDPSLSTHTYTQPQPRSSQQTRLTRPAAAAAATPPFPPNPTHNPHAPPPPPSTATHTSVGVVWSSSGHERVVDGADELLSVALGGGQHHHAVLHSQQHIHTCTQLYKRHACACTPIRWSPYTHTISVHIGDLASYINATHTRAHTHHAN